jgi:hypothetical protein
LATKLKGFMGLFLLLGSEKARALLAFQVLCSSVDADLMDESYLINRARIGYPVIGG